MDHDVIEEFSLNIQIPTNPICTQHVFLFVVLYICL